MNSLEIKTPLNEIIRLSEDNWKRIITEKHPIMENYISEVKETLGNTELICLSRWDKTVQLYYKKYGKYFVCVVVKMENSTGFLITTYLTVKIKVGEELWRK